MAVGRLRDSPEGALSAHQVPAEVQAIALRALPGLALAEPQAGLGHQQTVRAQELPPGSPAALLHGDPLLVQEDAAQHLLRHREPLGHCLFQPLEVQRAPVVTQGPEDELGDGGSHRQL